MGVTGLSVLINPDHADYHFGGIMDTATPEEPPESTDPQKDETPSPPKPVDNPDLPVEGDPEDFDEEPVADDEFSETGEAVEPREEREAPNDLSGIDKEFDD